MEKERKKRKKIEIFQPWLEAINVDQNVALEHFQACVKTSNIHPVIINGDPAHRYRLGFPITTTKQCIYYLYAEVGSQQSFFIPVSNTTDHNFFFY